MRKSGRVNSISIPGCLLGAVLLTALAATVLALLIYYGYYGLKNDISKVAKRMKKMEQRVAALDKGRPPLLSLRHLHPTPARPAKPAKPVIEPGKKPGTKPVVKRPVVKPPTKPPKPAKPPQPALPAIPKARHEMASLTISRLIYAVNTKRLKVSFALENKDRRRPLSGYFLVVGVGADRKGAVSEPSTKLEAFLPVNYKKGTYFSIRRYKSVRVRLKPRNGVKRIGLIMVLVYDADGNLKVVRYLKVLP